MVINFVVFISIQDSWTTEIVATKNETSVRGIVKKMMQEGKMLDMMMNKFVIDMEEKDISCISTVQTNISRPLLSIQERKKKNWN